jgi:hypothetical protein
MEQKDCFRQVVRPDVEFPFPDLQRTGCCPDAECLELVMEVSELAMKESPVLQLQVREIPQRFSPLTLPQASEQQVQPVLQLQRPVLHLS